MQINYQYNLMSFFAIFISLIIILTNFFFPEMSYKIGETISYSTKVDFSTNFIAMLLFFIAIFFQIVRFLRPNEIRYIREDKSSIYKFYNLENEYLRINELTVLSDEEKKQIKNELYTAKLKEFRNELKSDSDDSINETDDLVILKKSFSEIKNRLKNEIRDLMNRGSINLGAGVIITFAAVLILWFSLDDFYRTIGDTTNKSTLELIISILPRLSLVLLVEIFAYFFLRLYKIGLDDIKYYQNELTNIESKLISVEVAYITKNYKAMKKALNVLVQTERNFILKKGETTVELERAKSESENMQNILKAVPEFFKNKGK